MTLKKEKQTPFRISNNDLVYLVPKQNPSERAPMSFANLTKFFITRLLARKFSTVTRTSDMNIQKL